MCLFNNEVLRSKILDAKAVLNSNDGDVDDAQSTKSAPAPVPVTPQPKKLAQPASISSPQTPDLSSRGPSAAASPAPTTGNNIAGISYTIASLARLPAAEIIRLANSSNVTGLPLPKADTLIVRTTDEFIDGLLDKPIQQQKQVLGEKLFKVVKSLGIKGAVRLCLNPLIAFRCRRIIFNCHRRHRAASFFPGCSGNGPSIYHGHVALDPVQWCSLGS
jgi:polyadenylate-binding protein